MLFLHGFCASFVTDGYTMGILGLLVVLALAGELESARVGAFQIKFRRLALQRIESGLDDLSPDSGQGPEPENDGGGGGEPEALSPSGLVHEWRSLAEASPTAAVLAFTEVERLIDRLYEPIRDMRSTHANFSHKVDLLARYRVISASEARIVLDLLELKNSYVHGDRVDQDEAIRLIAVGARLLPALSAARRRIGRAFEDQVGEILERIGQLVFARQYSFQFPGGRTRQVDFFLIEPVQIGIEAKPVSERMNLVKREMEVQSRFGGSDLEVVVVVPAMAREFLEGRAARGTEKPFLWVPIDEFQAWLEARIKEET